MGKKYEKISEDIEKMFEGVLENTSIPNWLLFELRSDVTQKEACKIVKMNNLVESITEGVNFAVVFNEEIFDQLPDNLKIIAIDECLAGVTVSDTDVVSLIKPDFCTYTGVLKKYGDNQIVVLHESIITLLAAKKQKEDEEKAARKEKRGKKAKNNDQII